MKRAEFLVRLQAAGVDVLVCLVTMLVAGFAAGSLASSSWVASIAGWLAGIGYSAVEIFTGASIGKVIFELKLTDELGETATRASLVRRWFVKHGWMAAWFVGTVTTLSAFYWVGVAMAAAGVASFLLGIGPGRSAWHDAFARTRVIRSAGPEATSMGETGHSQRPPMRKAA